MGERTRELTVLILGDILVFNVALWVTLFLRYVEIRSGARLEAQVEPFLIFTVIWIVVFFILGLYDKHTNLLKRLLLSRILYAQVLNVVLAAVLFFVMPFGIAPKTNLVIYLVVSVVLMTSWRLFLVPQL